MDVTILLEHTTERMFGILYNRRKRVFASIIKEILNYIKGEINGERN